MATETARKRVRWGWFLAGAAGIALGAVLAANIYEMRTGERINMRIGERGAVSVENGGQPPACGDPVAPTYTPVFLHDFNVGTIGDNCSRISGPNSRHKYSTDVDGPFAEAGGQVCEQRFTELCQSYFMGQPDNDPLNLSEGGDLWWRAYYFFPRATDVTPADWAGNTPMDYCFGAADPPTCPPASGNCWGRTKWFRMDGQPGAFRSTYQMGGFACHLGNVTGTGAGCGTFGNWEKITRERFAGNQEANMPNELNTIVLGKWVAIQGHIHFSANPSVGYYEGWVDGDYAGRVYAQTLASGGTVLAISFGDYLNGGSPVDYQEFYFDEMIITTQAPNTTDADCNPFIHPATKVADFP